MRKYLNVVCMLLVVSLINGLYSTSMAQVNVVLDNYFNQETNQKTGKPYHYLWTDTENSGFSLWGDIFKSKGAKISMLRETPTKNNLKNANIYIIVDPDTTSENPNPNYITDDDIKVIVQWVKKGGALLLMANDAPNCEFTHLNHLAKRFGMYFNHVTINRVEGKNWNMGAFTNLPDHPLFKNVSKIYMKEVSSLTLSGTAKPVLKKGEAVIMAENNFGKGFVFSIGDPWIYNEYIDHDHLTDDFENRKAAENLTNFLMEKTPKN